MLHDHSILFTLRNTKNIIIGQHKSIFQLQLQLGLYSRYIQTSRTQVQITMNPQSSLNSAELHATTDKISVGTKTM